MQIRMLRRLQARTCAGFAVLAMALSVLAGCATDGKVKAAPVADRPSVSTGPSVARLEDGREGFIITEVPTLDNASRRDFDRAVAKLEDQDFGQAIDLLEKVIKQSPGVTAPYIDLAIAYLRVGKPEQ